MRQKLSREENRRAWLYAVAIVAGMLLIPVLVWLLWPETDTSRRLDAPETSQTVLDAAATMDEIRIDAVLDPEKRTLTATQVMTLRSPADEPLDEVVLRSYSGAYLDLETSPAGTDELYYSCYGSDFSPGGLQLAYARVNGKAVIYSWEDEAMTVLKLPLLEAWQPGETLTVELSYQVTIPECASRFGVSEEIMTLGNVFPTLAVWDHGQWRKDAYVSIGDPFLSECANWTVHLTLPASYSVAATGYARPVVSGDTAVYTMQAYAVRDFAMVVSDSFVSASAIENDVLVVAWAKTETDALAMLKTARQAVVCYEKHYGDYVYPTLTLAQANFPFGGMEYPGLVMIGSDVLRAGEKTLEHVVAHETAHQWWYAMVGSDSWRHPWQDESLCEYALMDYIGMYEGASARDAAVFEQIETALRITVARNVTPGCPIDYFSDLTEYTHVVYYRGAALWMALETYMGKEQLDAFLQDYRREFLFGMASRQEMTDLLNRHAGIDLTALIVDYIDTQMQ